MERKRSASSATSASGRNDDESPATGQPVATTSSAGGTAPERRGGRIKKARVVYDPSEESVARRPRNATAEAVASTSAAAGRSTADPERSQQQQQPSKKAAAPEASASLPKRGRPTKSATVANRATSTNAASAASKPLPSAAGPAPAATGPCAAAATAATAARPQPPPPRPPPADYCLLCDSLDAHLPSLMCVECNTARVHIDCLADTSEFHADAEEADWLCDTCRTCTGCYENRIAGTLYTCFGCKANYHEACNTDFSGRRVPLGHIYKPHRIRCAECLESGLGERREQRYWQLQREQQRRQLRTAAAAATATAAADAATKPLRSASDFAGFSATEASQPSPTRNMLCSLLPPTPSPPLAPPTTNTTTNDDDVLLSPESEEDEDVAADPQFAAPSTPAEAAEMQRLLRRMAPFVSLRGGLLSESRSPVPDCRGWSKERLHKYLGRYLEASVVQPLLDEEVDGAALLLLTRKQVLELPGDGRLLELWAHVVRLQRRSNRLDLGYAK